MEIQPAATEAAANNTGDLENDPLMVGPPAHKKATFFRAFCESPFTSVLCICYGIYSGLSRTLHLDPVASTSSQDEQDSMKEAILFGFIVFLYVFPVIFIILEVKNEIQFWWGREPLEGLSVRLVFFDVFQSLIKLLYLLDHDTSTLIKIGTSIRIGIEVWKVHKFMDVKMDLQNPYMGFIPVRIAFKSSYVDSNTNDYDAQAFKTLSWALLYPLFIAYAMYSHVYEEHQGWYSSVLSMLHGYIPKIACLMPIVQLFINYKLKSVAHLPWRMMTYRALRSFIDDIAASVTKKPSRSCVRGRLRDIIFLVFLYQRWIYRVSPSRLNECGVSKQVLEARQNDNVLISDPVIEAAVDPLIQDEVILATAPKAQERKKKD